LIERFRLRPFASGSALSRPASPQKSAADRPIEGDSPNPKEVITNFIRRKTKSNALIY
jgi:hypothetical protein